MLDPEENDLTDEQREELKNDLRRFWGRVVYFTGMLAGFIPLILLPSTIFTAGAHNPGGAVLVQGFNLLTVLPASVLAYWSRAVAAWWLVVDGVVLFCYTTLRNVPGGPVDRWELFLLAGIPLFLGGFGLYSQMNRWPPLLNRRKTR
jgi:hypothetical protein